MCRWSHSTVGWLVNQRWTRLIKQKYCCSFFQTEKVSCKSKRFGNIWNTCKLKTQVKLVTDDLLNLFLFYRHLCSHFASFFDWIASPNHDAFRCVILHSSLALPPPPPSIQVYFCHSQFVRLPVVFHVSNCAFALSLVQTLSDWICLFFDNLPYVEHVFGFCLLYSPMSFISHDPLRLPQSNGLLAVLVFRRLRLPFDWHVATTNSLFRNSMRIQISTFQGVPYFVSAASFGRIITRATIFITNFNFKRISKKDLYFKKKSNNAFSFGFKKLVRFLN